MSGGLTFPDGVWPPRWAHEFADNPAVLADVQREIGEAYEGTDYPRPDPGQVVRTVLADIARDLREDAELDEECNKVDDCHAHAVVRYQLARWLSSVIIAHPQPERTDADRAWLDEVARREGLAEAQTYSVQLHPTESMTVIVRGPNLDGPRQLAVAPSGATPRHDLLIVRDENPHVESWPVPVDWSNEGAPRHFWFARVIQAVPGDACDWNGHKDSESTVTVARVDLPPECHRLEPGMITLLHGVSQTSR